MYLKWGEVNASNCISLWGEVNASECIVHGSEMNAGKYIYHGVEMRLEKPTPGKHCLASHCKPGDANDLFSIFLPLPPNYERYRFSAFANV